MNTNPLLKKLGFSDDDRVAIIHADDIGMCQATIPAVAELFAVGGVSSAAVMVPCPWFRGAAAYARAHPEADLGVHITLNSEWATYRWGPLSTRDPASGLIDADGYFFGDPEPTQAGADVRAVEKELRVQFQTAAAAGIAPTHADTHMFCLGHPRFFRTYVDTAVEAQTYPVLIRPGSPGWAKFGFPEAGPIPEKTNQMADLGFPMVDGVYMMNLDTHEDRLAEATAALDALPPGFTHFILHPAIDSPELRAMAPDWRCRVADYETFRSDALKEHIQNTGVQVIGYRALLDQIALPKQVADGPLSDE